MNYDKTVNSLIETTLREILVLYEPGTLIFMKRRKGKAWERFLLAETQNRGASTAGPDS